jgi:urease beta subunit
VGRRLDVPAGTAIRFEPGVTLPATHGGGGWL